MFPPHFCHFFYDSMYKITVHFEISRSQCSYNICLAMPLPISLLCLNMWPKSLDADAQQYFDSQDESTTFSNSIVTAHLL